MKIDQLADAWEASAIAYAMAVEKPETANGYGGALMDCARELRKALGAAATQARAAVGAEQCAQQCSAVSDRPSLPDLPPGLPDEVRVLMTRYAMRSVEEALGRGELRGGFMPQMAEGSLSDETRLSLLNKLARHRGFENAAKALESLPLALSAQTPGELDVSDALRKLRFVSRVLDNFAQAPVSDRADAHQFVKELIEAVWKSGRVSQTPGEGWMPIKSAPKDGTKVELWCPFWTDYATGAWDVIYGGWRWPSGYEMKGASGTPTHWHPRVRMALPKPPATPGEA